MTKTKISASLKVVEQGWWWEIKQKFSRLSSQHFGLRVISFTISFSTECGVQLQRDNYNALDD